MGSKQLLCMLRLAMWAVLHVLGEAQLFTARYDRQHAFADSQDVRPDISVFAYRAHFALSSVLRAHLWVPASSIRHWHQLCYAALWRRAPPADRSQAQRPSHRCLH